jgi:predicted extracellular nuclease
VFAFDDPGDRQLNRPAVVAAFEDADGGVVTIANNHFKSKGPSGVDAGDPNADQGDGQGNWNVARTAAAEQLTAWLATDPLGVGDPDVLIIGDLNAYSQEDPVQAIEAAGYDNLIEAFIGAADAFSFVFDGQRGALDHALATESLRGQVTGVAEWHVNAEEPDLMSYSSEFTNAGFFDPSSPFGASDHDPLIVGLTLTAPEDDLLLA